MKIVTIIGARPQFIKAGAVSRAIADYNARNPEMSIKEIIVHTGQHYDTNMSQVFFEELQIPRPDYNLEVGSGNHGAMTGAMLAKIEEVLIEEEPDLLIVYGDTNSTLAGAVAAVKMHIPVVHVEAGLRSYNRCMPEEVNRIIADHAANILLCPTDAGVANLEKEGIFGDRSGRPLDFNTRRVYQVGDVMYDSVLFNGRLAEEKSRVLDDLGLVGETFALATLHRAENTDVPERLHEILKAFLAIAEEQMPLVLPLHPRTRKCVAKSGLILSGRRLHLIEPVGYLDMMQLERNAAVILTDSGGVQKEAFFLGVPCITLRDETEWTETVERGWNYLAGADLKRILEGFSRAVQSSSDPAPFSSRHEIADTGEYPYGDGHAAEKIIEILTSLGSEAAIGDQERQLSNS